jgi:hypothetical protein
MCFSFRSAIFSFISAMIAAVVAFSTRQVVLGCLILAYAQMQLSEIMIWRGVDTDNVELNKKGTSYGKYMLATHPMAIGIGIILSLLFISKQKLKPTDFIPLIVGVIFFTFICIKYYAPNNYDGVTYPVKTCSDENKCKDGDNRLKWPYPFEWYTYSYIISLLIIVFFIKPTKNIYCFFFIFTLTLIMTYIIYPKTVGTVWCWSTSFIAPVIVLISWYLIRNCRSEDILV